jgi:hypothetical protein
MKGASMNKRFFITVLAAGVMQLSAAPLVIANEVQQVFDDLTRGTITSLSLASSHELLDTAPVGGRPVAFRVTLRTMSDDDVDLIVRDAGIGDSLRRFAGYDEKKGRCYYYSPHLSKLENESEYGLRKLRDKSAAVLKTLLGERSRFFVYANHETDWAITSDDPKPHRTMYTCRYTRKVNGRHIVGNDAFARISFTGSEELCAFEFCDPNLEPVPVKRMVLPSATRMRLERYAGAKNKVRGTLTGEVSVMSIVAAKGVLSYVGRCSGANKLLVPSVSVLCRHTLVNGTSFEKFSHFVLDASQVSNLDESMLEPMVR